MKSSLPSAEPGRVPSRRAGSRRSGEGKSADGGRETLTVALPSGEVVKEKPNPVALPSGEVVKVKPNSQFPILPPCPDTRVRVGTKLFCQRVLVQHSQAQQQCLAEKKSRASRSSSNQQSAGELPGLAAAAIPKMRIEI
ncbi:hypothetical protein JHW43_003228 [Diplocarpon mali]|nr:hypothetical protein JHW43_003228 [Diplocarpon mali]